MRAQSLDQEDLLEEKMATPSSILAWRIPWTEEPGGLTVHSATKSLKQLHTHLEGWLLCCYYFYSQDPGGRRTLWWWW